MLGAKRDIDCSYEDSVEPTLLEHPRELIQVFGSVSIDSKGVPKTIESVELIRPIQEEESISIDSYLIGNKTIRARRPLAISIRFDREEQLLVAALPPLGIETVGETRDDVAEGIVAELRVLWRNYVQGDERQLTAGARVCAPRLQPVYSPGG